MNGGGMTDCCEKPNWSCTKMIKGDLVTYCCNCKEGLPDN